MTRRTRWAVLALITAFAAPVVAQPTPSQPSGPAELIKRANEGRTRGELERAQKAGEAAAQAQGAPATPPAHGALPSPDAVRPGSTPQPMTAAPAAAPPPAAPPPGHDPHAALADPSMPSADPAPELSRGTIAVEVLDPRGQPYPNAEIVLGVMASMGGRTEQRAKTGADGRHTFEKLATGGQQAYRVNVSYGGAKFSSTPFQLPDGSGYRVRIPLQATTRDAGMVFQVIGQTLVELRDDRLHVTQQARLANAGQSVYVLPGDGMLVKLPEGFTAFQWQDQMTDQRAEEAAGKGFRLRGSLPPGSVTLAWSYDLVRSGSQAKIPVELPFRSFTYRVIAEAPQGLSLRVSDFPEPERVKSDGRELLFTQVQRSPRDPQLTSFSIKIDGIPGPGPGRWVATALALLAVALGLSRAFKGADKGRDRGALIATRKQALLSQARATEAEHARGEIGPEFRARRMDEIATELALVLRDEEALGAATKR
jgi:hypothetical protein